MLHNTNDVWYSLLDHNHVIISDVTIRNIIKNSLIECNTFTFFVYLKYDVERKVFYTFQMYLWKRTHILKL